MTDDNNSRYRSSDPYSHDPANAPASAGQGASDPLAELARLIGKNDPFSEFGRLSNPPAPPPRDTYREPRFEDPAPQAGYHEAGHQYDSHQHQDVRNDTRYDASFPPHSGGWDATAQPAPAYDPFAPHAQPAPLAADTHYEDHPYAAGSHASGQPQPVIDTYQPEHEPQFDADTRYDNENAPRLGDVPGFAPPPFHPAESGAAQPSEDQFYDDAPPRRRKGLVTVMAVLALAVVGTAGAFGYRSYVRGGGPSLSLPPIIKASTEPTKVAPPAPAQTADASKISYDRFGDRGQNEKVVPREEQPVDQREIVRSSSVPRTVLPGAPAPSASPALPPNAQASNQPSNNAPSALGEPKRIRTVPIRPDQAVDASASASAVAKQVATLPAPPPQAAPAPLPVQQAAPPPAAPLETTPVPQRAAAPPPAPVERAPRPQRNAQSAPAANAPLSLAPDATNSAPPPVASAPAPRPAAPMRVASAPSNGGTGGYLVQVSSQRSEADAQSAFRSVQGKYSSVLSGQQHVIRRVELGEKGTYYRAMVGPFATREQAVQLCSSLKSAGGDCVVQSN